MEIAIIWNMEATAPSNVVEESLCCIRVRWSAPQDMDWGAYKKQKDSGRRNAGAGRESEAY